MTKKILCWLLALSMSLTLLTGCGKTPTPDAPNTGSGEKTPSSSGEKAPASEVTELELWYWESEREQPWNDNLIADFEAANPNIKINLTIMPWTEYWQKIQTATISNTLPDLMIMSVAYIEKYADAGVVIDLKDYIDRDLDRNEYYEFAMQTTRMADGHEYGMPWNIVGNCLFYNKELFDIAGLDYPNADWTWEDLRANAIALSDPAENQYGFTMTLAEGLDSVIYSYGGAVVNDELTECVINSPEAMEGVQFIRSLLLDDKCMVPVASEVSGSTNFSTGKVAMAVDGCWFMETMATSSQINWDIAELPAGPSGSRPRAWSDSICITKDSKNPEMAWEFIKFLVSAEGQTIANLSGTRIPVYIPASMSDSFLKNPSLPCNLEVLIKGLEKASPFIYRGNWGEWVNVLTNEMFGAFTGDLSVEDACKNTKAGIDLILDDYNANK